MKKAIFASALLAATIISVTQSSQAQSAVDALQVTQRDFKGTARFMSMGGAFTALGGDLSAINLNPAGIGVYRSSEIAATLDIDIQGTKGTSDTYYEKNSQTKAYCNNFGYVGTALLDHTLQTFSWGVTYNRLASFDRLVSGYAQPVGTSLTNYIAAFTGNTPAEDLAFGTNYNPYIDSNCDWLSILAYNSYLINNVNGSDTQYRGLFQAGTDGDSCLMVHEKGYVDNYEFTFGGNFADIVFWGLGIGINDLRYLRYTNYSEIMTNAAVYAENSPSGITPGKAEYYLDNNKIITGTGWNLSFGLIAKPIQELRIGASIISPTWYNLSESYFATVDYAITPTNTRFESLDGYEYTEDADFNWRLRSPWRFNIGAAGVISNKAIISFDYELQAYPDMTMKNATYDKWGYITGYAPNNFINENIRQYTQNASNIRLGVEYRITPSFSARLGYNLQTSNINSEYQNAKAEIITSGTDPSFSLDKTTNYISAGLGYRFGGFYADATYVHKTATSTLHPYTSYADVDAPRFDVTDNNNSIVLSVGFKF